MADFEYLEKNNFSVIGREIFNILADNMETIAPTGNKREDDYGCWYSGVSEGLKHRARNIILIKNENTIIGFFQYYVNNGTLMMEEAQLVPSYQGKGIFKCLCRFLFENTKEKIEFVEAFANVNNTKSITILKKAGLENIGMNNNGRSFHFRGEYSDFDEWFNRDTASENISIEPLKPEDYVKCGNIWNMKAQPFADKWLEEIRSGNRLVFVYKINGEFIGEGALVINAGDPDYTVENRRIYVSRMIVKKEYRNCGIGSKILTFLIEKAKEMGYREMTIGVDKDNTVALGLYRKFGFNEVLFDGADKDGEYYKLLKRI